MGQLASALVAGGALSAQDASEMIEKIADVISSSADQHTKTLMDHGAGAHPGGAPHGASAPSLDWHPEQLRGTCVAVAQVGSCLSRLRPRRTNFSGDSPRSGPTEALTAPARCRGFLVLGGSGASTTAQL